MAPLVVLVALAWIVSVTALGRDDVPTVESRADIPVGLSYGNRLLSLSDTDLAAALDDAVTLHTPWIRVDLSWADMQPDSAGDHRWASTDRLVAAAGDRGLKVLGIVTYTPPWARAAGCTTFACPPADGRQFARFAHDVAERYAGRISAYEIWNEPNLALFWTDPDPAAYGRLLDLTIPAIRTADDEATVILGGLAALPTGDRSIDAADFIRGACGSRDCSVDAVAYHPYTFPRLASAEGDPPTAWARMLSDRPGSNGIRTAMAEVGLSDRRIWVTEYGAPTIGDRPGDDHVSEAQQSAILRDALRSAEQDSGIIGAFFWYTWKDYDSYGSNEDGFGLRRTDGTAKPAFFALARALAP